MDYMYDVLAVRPIGTYYMYDIFVQLPSVLSILKCIQISNYLKYSCMGTCISCYQYLKYMW